jgi:hypothetical protein
MPGYITIDTQTLKNNSKYIIIETVYKVPHINILKNIKNTIIIVVLYRGIVLGSFASYGNFLETH